MQQEAHSKLENAGLFAPADLLIPSVKYRYVG